MRDFKGLIVWQKAHRLTVAVYAVTASFPREERFGLTAQVRKSAASRYLGERGARGERPANSTNGVPNDNRLRHRTFVR